MPRNLYGSCSGRSFPSCDREPFEVVRQEPVSAGARGTVTAWLVDSTKPGNYIMRFWLMKAPPYIIKPVMSDEAHGRVLTWDML
jgi:hypothetical protein